MNNKMSEHIEAVSGTGMYRVSVLVPEADKGAMLNEAQRLRDYNRANVQVMLMSLQGRDEVGLRGLSHLKNDFHRLTRADLLEVIDALWDELDALE